MKKFVFSLESNELVQVLHRLLDKNPGILQNAYEISVAITSDVDEESVADDVFYALDGIDVDELFSRSGSSRYGYIEPSEEAWEMFEETISPFIHEMKKCHSRKQDQVAKIHCIGIIKGLRKYDNNAVSDFKDWIPDAPGNYISTVVEEWKKGNPSVNDISDVSRTVEQLGV